MGWITRERSSSGNAKEWICHEIKYGHRGANQPVKYLANGRVYISSQNHGYAVKNESLPKGAVGNQ